MGSNRREKFLVLFLLVCGMLATNAAAYLVVNLDSLDGAYLNNGGTGWGFPTFTAGDAVVSTLLQVIWSEDADIGDATPGGGVAADGLDTDRVLYSATTTAFGQVDEEPTNSGIQIAKPGDIDDTTFYGGYLYLRVFDSVSPVAGSYYVSGSQSGVGVPWTGLSNSPSFSSDYEQLDMTTSSDAVADPNWGSGHIPLDTPVIPEPGVLSLFALGLATVAARRFRRS